MALLDKALDFAVLPGYTAVGYHLRGLSWEQATAGSFVRGRSVLVTGASSGLGEAVCEGLSLAGARVHMLVRDRGRGEAARARILRRIAAQGSTPSPELELELCDISRPREVREFASEFARRVPKLAALVNNAGVLSTERRSTPEGHELTFATNALGPFVLTNSLLPVLREAGRSRVVNVTSGGMYTNRLDVDDVELKRRSYDGPRAYAHTKRIEVVLTQLWAEREPGDGVAIFAAHPGWADTPGLAASLPRFRSILKPLLRSARAGADTIVWLATVDEPDSSSGDLVHDRRTRPRHRLRRTVETAAERERLWDQLEQLAT